MHEKGIGDHVSGLSNQWGSSLQGGPSPGEGRGAQKLHPLLGSLGYPAMRWLPCWKLRRTPQPCYWGCPRQDEQGSSHMEQRSVVKARCSFRATWTRCREKCLGPDIRGGFSQARGLGAPCSEIRKGMADALGERAARAPHSG